MQTERLCMPSGEGACTCAFLQVVFWEGQWWTLPCFHPLFEGNLKTIAVSRKGLLVDVCLSSHSGSCRQVLSAHSARLRVIAGSQRKATAVFSAPTATSSSNLLKLLKSDWLVEVAAKFPVAAVLPVFLGSCWKLPSRCCITEVMWVLANCWFQKQLPSLLVCGVWCYPWISVLGFLHNLMEGLSCRCL